MLREPMAACNHLLGREPIGQEKRLLSGFSLTAGKKTATDG
jgi:hypothetical protein